MRRIRHGLLSAAMAVALLLPLAQVASADPGDGGVPGALTTTDPTRGWSTTTLDPGDGGVPGE